MPKCRMSPIKHRIGKPHGGHSHGSSKSNFKRGMRGHSWKGHGITRICERCGIQPKQLRNR